MYALKLPSVVQHESLLLSYRLCFTSAVYLSVLRISIYVNVNPSSCPIVPACSYLNIAQICAQKRAGVMFSTLASTPTTPFRSSLHSLPVKRLYKSKEHPPSSSHYPSSTTYFNHLLRPPSSTASFDHLLQPSSSTIFFNHPLQPPSPPTFNFLPSTSASLINHHPTHQSSPPHPPPHPTPNQPTATPPQQLTD